MVSCKSCILLAHKERDIDATFFYSIYETKQYLWRNENSGMGENKSIANKTQ